MPRKVVLNKKEGLYGYLRTGRYVREKLASRRGCKKYRVKTVKPGVKLLICITKKGKTKAVSLLRDIERVDLRSYRREGKRDIYYAIKKARKLKEKEE